MNHGYRRGRRVTSKGIENSQLLTAENFPNLEKGSSMYSRHFEHQTGKSRKETLLNIF
jgi:hypothetical protein